MKSWFKEYEELEEEHANRKCKNCKEPFPKTEHIDVLQWRLKTGFCCVECMENYKAKRFVFR